METFFTPGGHFTAAARRAVKDHVEQGLPDGMDGMTRWKNRRYQYFVTQLTPGAWWFGLDNCIGGCLVVDRSVEGWEPEEFGEYQAAWEIADGDMEAFRDTLADLSDADASMVYQWAKIAGVKVGRLFDQLGDLQYYADALEHSVRMRRIDAADKVALAA